MKTNPIEGNKLIAEFIGVKKMGNSLYYVPEHELLQRVRYSNECEEVSLFDERELKYHNSWDWLMPVVEKIENSGHETMVQISANYCTIDNLNGLRIEKQSDSKLDSVYLACVEFIEWDNQEK